MLQKDKQTDHCRTGKTTEIHVENVERQSKEDEEWNRVSEQENPLNGYWLIYIYTMHAQPTNQQNQGIN